MRRYIGWLVAGAVIAGVLAQGGSARTATGADAQRLYRGNITWTMIGGKGNTVIGKGSFSAHLGATATALAYAYGALTGVPLADIAKGGSYVLRFTSGKTGARTGTLVAKFKDRALGTTCAGYSAKFGKYVNGNPFVPMSGTLHTVGGTGDAAHWKITLSFTQTGVSGATVEQFPAKGKVAAATGAAHGPTAACRALAKLLK